MPIDKGQQPIPIHETDIEQTNEEEILEQYLDESNDEEEDDDDDEITAQEEFKEELEHAYQCDFTKIAPPPSCPNTSLLSNLLSCSTTTPVKQNSTKRDYSAAIGIRSTLPNAMVSEGQLSESLKRNLAREHSQSSLKKYKNIKRSSSFDSLTDNFSRY